MSSSCALMSCTQTTSHGSARASQRAKPLRSAERMPLRLRVMMRIDAMAARRLRAGARSVHDRLAVECRPMSGFRSDFLAFALARDVLRFGQFVTKAGRQTPYFFNAGLFNDGESLRRLGQFYAEAYLASGIACDQLFGPAYKGITAGRMRCLKRDTPLRKTARGDEGSR